MKHNVVAPSVGESITEVSILKWLKSNGQQVKNGEVLLEIESDKATVEVAAEATGALTIVKQAGERMAVGAVIGQIDQLPSLPSSYWALSDAIRRPDVTAEKLAGLVEQDPALTVRLLQLVNSAYFGLPRRVASVQQAIKIGRAHV